MIELPRSRGRRTPFNSDQTYCSAATPQYRMLINPRGLSSIEAVGIATDRYGDKGLKPTAEQTGTWLEFNWGDVAALSVTKYLVDLGMSSHGAFTVAKALVEKRWPGLFVDDPCWSLNSDNSLWFFYLTRDGEWGFGSLEHSEIRGIGGDARVTIIVTLHNVILDAFYSLGEMGHSLPRCDRSELDAKLAARTDKNIVNFSKRDNSLACSWHRKIHTRVVDEKDPDLACLPRTSAS